jgi:hypothetical protein
MAEEGRRRGVNDRSVLPGRRARSLARVFRGLQAGRYNRKAGKPAWFGWAGETRVLCWPRGWGCADLRQTRVSLRTANQRVRHATSLRSGWSESTLLYPQFRERRQYKGPLVSSRAAPLTPWCALLCHSAANASSRGGPPAATLHDRPPLHRRAEPWLAEHLGEQRGFHLRRRCVCRIRPRRPSSYGILKAGGSAGRSLPHAMPRSVRRMIRMLNLQSRRPQCV